MFWDFHKIWENILFRVYLKNQSYHPIWNRKRLLRMLKYCLKKWSFQNIFKFNHYQKIYNFELFQISQTTKNGQRGPTAKCTPESSCWDWECPTPHNWRSPSCTEVIKFMGNIHWLLHFPRSWRCSFDRVIRSIYWLFPFFSSDWEWVWCYGN